MTMERDSLVARLTRAGGAMANILYNLKQQTYGTERIRDQMDEAQLEWDAALRTFQEGSAAAALSHPEQVVPPTSERPTSDAWKLVPVEPTQTMLVAGNDMFHRRETPLNIYRAMLASAPASPAIGVQAVTGLSEETQCQLDAIDEAIRAGAMAGNMIVGSALHPAPEAASAGAAVTCATEGCEQPATCRFERKGVGSVYCGECFGRIIEAVDRASDTAPSPKGVSDGVRADEQSVSDRAKFIADALGVTPYSDMRVYVIRAVELALTGYSPATAEERAASKEGDRAKTWGEWERQQQEASK